MDERDFFIMMSHGRHILYSNLHLGDNEPVIMLGLAIHTVRIVNELSELWDQWSQCHGW